MVVLTPGLGGMRVASPEDLGRGPTVACREEEQSVREPGVAPGQIVDPGRGDDEGLMSGGERSSGCPYPDLSQRLSTRSVDPTLKLDSKNLSILPPVLLTKPSTNLGFYVEIGSYPCTKASLVELYQSVFNSSIKLGRFL